MERHKIHYTKDGWVCNRYPYDISIDDEERFIEVDEATFQKTLGCDNHFLWRVKNGELYHEQYEPIPEAEIIENLRDIRAEVCFPVINRGQPWHDTLSSYQKKELAKWYNDWLNVTKTKKEPPPPRWLFNDKKEVDNGTNKN